KIDGGLEVVAAHAPSLLPRATAASAAEEPAEDVAEVAEVEVAAEVEVGAAEARAAVRAEPVVLLALLGVGEEVVGRLYLDDPVAEPVALLDHLEDRPLVELRRLREQRLVHVRVEGAFGLDLGEPLAAEDRRERAVDEAHALLELRLLVLGRCLERPAEVVQ